MQNEPTDGSRAESRGPKIETRPREGSGRSPVYLQQEMMSAASFEIALLNLKRASKAKALNRTLRFKGVCDFSLH